MTDLSLRAHELYRKIYEIVPEKPDSFERDMITEEIIAALKRVWDEASKDAIKYREALNTIASTVDRNEDKLVLLFQQIARTALNQGDAG